MPNQKRAIRIAQRNACKTAYLKRYQAAPGFAFPNDFDLADNDLLLTESIRTPTHTEVLLYWISQERSRAREPLVENTLGLTQSEAVGEVVQVLIPSAPKWTENPKKVFEFLLYAAAIFGAWSVVRDNLTELFAWQNIVIFAANAAVPNVHTGDQFKIPLIVRNEDRLGHAEVQLLSVTLTSVDGLDKSNAPGKVQFNIASVPLQAGQQNVDVSFLGTAPEVHGTQLQRYSIAGDAKAKGGFLCCQRKAVNSPFTITVWPDRSWKAELHQTGPDTARVDIMFNSGVAAPTGVTGQLSFDGGVPPEPDGVVLMPTSNPKRDGDPIITGSQAKIQFKTQAAQAFSSNLYQISIGFVHPLSQSEWSSLRSSIQVNFE